MLVKGTELIGVEQVCGWTHTGYLAHKAPVDY